MERLEQAKKALQQPEVTFAAVSANGVCVTSDKKGIVPMMEILETNPTFLSDAVVADKVIGKAAAFLLIKGNVKAVYAQMMSHHALETLQQTNIFVQYQTVVPYIINRNKDGMCPMEETVLSIQDAEQAFVALQEKRKALEQKRNKEILLQNLENIHTTPLGTERIQRNIGLECDVVAWCKDCIKTATNIKQKGKNWYISNGNTRITIHANRYTIITAHKQT